MKGQSSEDPGAWPGTWLSPDPLHLRALSTWSPQSRDRKMVGDITGAQAFASTAKCLNIWALIFNIILTIICMIVYVRR